MPRPRAGSATAPRAAQTVERLLNMMGPGMREHDARTRRFDRSYQTWRGGMRTTRPKGTAESWRSNVRPKYGMQIVDQAMANLAEGIPTATVLPRRPGDEQAAEALEEVLGYFAQRDHLAEKEIQVTQNALIYGVSACRNSWCYSEDASGSPVEDRPTMTPWDPYNVWWDPLAYDVDTAQYVALRSFLTKDDLLSQAYDDQTGTGAYKNLDLLFTGGQNNFPRPDTTAQNRMMPLPADVMKDRFEIVELWYTENGRTNCAVVGNRTVLLRDGPSPHRLLGKPVTISNSRPDLFRIEGVSETEMIEDLQEALWQVGNLRLDQWKMTVLRGATVRESAGLDLRQMVFRPGFIWPVQDHDDVHMVSPAELPAEAYKEDEVLLQKAQFITGIGPGVTGQSAVGGGVSTGTATGDTLATQSQSKLIQLKAQVIHYRTWQRTFDQWAVFCRQYLGDGTAIRIIGPGGEVGWRTYSRGDIAGDFDVDIEAGDKSATVQQSRAEMIQLLQVLQPYMQEGLVDPKPLLKKIAKLFGFKSPEELLPNRPPAPAASPVPRLNLTAKLTPEQEMAAAQMAGLPGGEQGQLPQGQPPQIQGGQIVPQPLQAVMFGHRR